MALQRAEVVEMLTRTQAMLEGHFLLTSGLHSPNYFQCARVLQYPENAAALCADLAGRFDPESVDVVVSPAIGGIVVGQEVARILGRRSIFTERENGKMTLRRGFLLEEGERVLIVEDVLTTGKSIKEVMEVIREREAVLKGIGVIVDRSGGKANMGHPAESIFQAEVQTYHPESCPLCKQGIPVVKPGSRQMPESA